MSVLVAFGDGHVSLLRVVFELRISWARAQFIYPLKLLVERWMVWTTVRRTTTPDATSIRWALCTIWRRALE